MHVEPDNYWHVEYQPGRHSRPILRELIDTVVLTVLIFLVVRAVVPSYWVEGDSMLPTLHSGQRLLVNRLPYFRFDASTLAHVFDPDAPTTNTGSLFSGPQRGDIVVFQPPQETESHDDFIKRVIAVEGETVEVRSDSPCPGEPSGPCNDCAVYVNGVKLNEPYIKQSADYSMAPTTVPPGHIFVLGDNRRNSSDSHVWGALPIDKVVGTAFVSYWPQDQLGFFPHPSYAEIR